MSMMDVRRRPARLPTAGAPARPAWWGPEDDADRNAAARGCPKTGALCAYCTIKCPLERRSCRTCAMWASADGALGVCERGPAGAAGDEPGTRAGDFCRHWRART